MTLEHVERRQFRALLAPPALKSHLTQDLVDLLELCRGQVSAVSPGNSDQDTLAFLLLLISYE